jgi:hypothetical protein
MPSAHITALPKKAFLSPPASSGGGWFCVNSAQLTPPMPLETSVHRIQPRKHRPNRAATVARPMAMPLTMRRRR